MSEDGTLSIQVVGRDAAYSMEVTSALDVREFADWITRQVASFRERDTTIRSCQWVPVHHAVARPVRGGSAVSDAACTYPVPYLCINCGERHQRRYRQGLRARAVCVCPKCGCLAARRMDARRNPAIAPMRGGYGEGVR